MKLYQENKINLPEINCFCQNQKGFAQQNISANRMSHFVALQKNDASRYCMKVIAGKIYNPYFHSNCCSTNCKHHSMAGWKNKLPPSN
jgi:hypothetical protein